MSATRLPLQDDGSLQIPAELREKLERPGAELRLVKDGEGFLATVDEGSGAPASRLEALDRLYGCLRDAPYTMDDFDREKRLEIASNGRH